MPLANTLVQVEFPEYALITQNPYKEEKRKNAKYKMLSFCTKYILDIKYPHANVLCLCIVYKIFQNVPEISHVE